MGITIKNGRVIHNDDYPYNFHTFFHDRTIDLFIIIPGIIVESLQIKISPPENNLTNKQTISLKAHVNREYQQLYKQNTISITGNIPEPIIQNAIYSTYKDGILKLELVRDLKNGNISK